MIELLLAPMLVDPVDVIKQEYALVLEEKPAELYDPYDPIFPSDILLEEHKIHDPLPAPEPPPPPPPPPVPEPEVPHTHPEPSAPQSAPQPAPQATSGVPWDAIARCESGYGGEPRWDINTGNGYYGGLQFNYDSWHWAGGGQYAEYPHNATREQQIATAEVLLSIHPAGLGAWPACTKALGLR